jgi:hypothetical protein
MTNSPVGGLLIFLVLALFIAAVATGLGVR